MSGERRLRSGLMALLALVVGLGALAEGLRWYAGHLDRLSAPAPRQAGSVPATTTTTTLPPVATPAPPSAEELAGLAASDPQTQSKAIEALSKRSMTPDLAAAVGACRPANETIGRRLDCLKARVPGVPLDWVLARLPDPDDAVWPTDMERCVCLLQALAARVEEDPDRVAEALFPFALSYPAAPRQPALEGLARTRFATLPRWAGRRIDQAWHPGLAVDAAFALRVEELDPPRVERWIFDADEGARYRVRSRLASSPSPGAARLLARQLVQHREDRDLLQWLDARERSRHDALAALAEIAVAEGEPHGERRAALELLSQHGKPPQATHLAPLRASGDEVLRAYAEAAVTEIEKRAKISSSKPGP